MNKLPKEFAFLSERKAQLLKELEQIEALEANLAETRQLMNRAMSCVGGMTQEEFAACQGGKYMQLFLDEKLEQEEV